MATVELNKENFEQVITGNDMVIVDFWGDRAGRSRDPSQAGCDPGAGCGRPTLKRGRWHPLLAAAKPLPRATAPGRASGKPLAWPIPLRGSLVPRFWVPWCGPCRSFAPTYEAASEKFPGVVFAKVNTEEEQELGGHFGIRSIPTLMVFRQRVILFSQPGALPASGLEGVITQSLALDMDKVRADIAAGAQKQG